MSAAGIYVHIPFCRSKCKYCDFVSACCDEGTQRRYVDALIREIYTGMENYSGEADTLYVGGGTPSCLFDGAAGRIVKAVKDAFGNSFKEITFECNPDSFDDKKAQELRDAGATRISLGVQSLENSVLRSIGRRHDRAAAKNAVSTAVGYGFDVNADLMLGLKGQTEWDIDEFVTYMSGEGVEHVSAYILKVEAGTPLAREVERGLVLPSDDECVKLYDYAYQRLAEEGYRRYETSNFCKNGKVCLHNMKYWTMRDYLAFGVSAHGKTGKLRYFNRRDINGYIESVNGGRHAYEVEEVLSDRDEIDEYIMLGLRLDEGIDAKALGEKFGFDFSEKYRDALRRAEPYIAFDGKRLKIKPRYALVANSVINMFV